MNSNAESLPNISQNVEDSSERKNSAESLPFSESLNGSSESLPFSENFESLNSSSESLNSSSESLNGSSESLNGSSESLGINKYTTGQEFSTRRIIIDPLFSEYLYKFDDLYKSLDTDIKEFLKNITALKDIIYLSKDCNICQTLNTILKRYNISAPEGYIAGPIELYFSKFRELYTLLDTDIRTYRDNLKELSNIAHKSVFNIRSKLNNILNKYNIDSPTEQTPSIYPYPPTYQRAGKKITNKKKIKKSAKPINKKQLSKKSKKNKQSKKSANPINKKQLSKKSKKNKQSKKSAKPIHRKQLSKKSKKTKK